MKFHRIEIDDNIFQLLREHAEPFVDTPNSVLRRLILKDGKSYFAKEKLQALNESSLAGMSSLPQSTPTALVHILEMIWLVKNRGYERTEATNLVARSSGVATQTVIDKYCRQLGKRAFEIDRLLESDSCEDFETLLAKRFPYHRKTLRDFFHSLCPASPDEQVSANTSQRKQRDPRLERAVKLSLGNLLKHDWGEYKIEGDSQLIFTVTGNRLLCKYSSFQDEQSRWFWGVCQGHWTNWTDHDYLALVLENQNHDGYSFLLLNPLQAQSLFEKCSESGGAKKMNMRLYKSDDKLHLQEWFEFPLEGKLKPLSLR